MYAITSRWPHQESIKVEWNLGKRCNYDCSYCPSAIHDNKSSHTDLALLKGTVDQLANLGKPVRLSFTGGEPCVHPQFAELVRYCKDQGVSWISVTTNGTLPVEFYTSLPVNQYVVSIHFEYYWLKVVNTAIKIKMNSSIPVIAQIMAHHSFMDDVRFVHSTLKNAEISNTVRRIRWTEGDHDLFDDMRYTVDDLQWIIDQTATVEGNCVVDHSDIMHANDIIKLHLNKYNGWVCNAGLESLMINWDGEVHRATCRVGGSLGNIYNGSFTVPTTPIVCDRNFCTCAADIPLTKVKK